jgi:hypothetical protein
VFHGQKDINEMQNMLNKLKKNKNTLSPIIPLMAGIGSIKIGNINAWSISAKN